MVRNNTAIGHTAQAVGASFEAWVEVQHDKARLLGILAHVYHNQPASKFIRGRLEYVERGVSDYTGTLEGGHAKTYAAEAKSTSDNRFPRAGIEPKQIEHLDAVARAGGLALLLVEFRVDVLPLRLRHAIPWLEIPWKTLRTAQSVSADDVATWRIPNDPTFCFLSRFHPGGPSSSTIRRRVINRD